MLLSNDADAMARAKKGITAQFYHTPYTGCFATFHSTLWWGDIALPSRTRRRGLWAKTEFYVAKDTRSYRDRPDVLLDEDWLWSCLETYTIRDLFLSQMVVRSQNIPSQSNVPLNFRCSLHWLRIREVYNNENWCNILFWSMLSFTCIFVVKEIFQIIDTMSITTSVDGRTDCNGTWSLYPALSWLILITPGRLLRWASFWFESSWWW